MCQYFEDLTNYVEINIYIHIPFGIECLFYLSMSSLFVSTLCIKYPWKFK